uniref:Uncharacterized protein n=1 Tax=Anopheles stephensi TaxID=30069 RepID=A0A182YMS1_ANOST
MAWKCLPYWKIPNDNFYPISMVCVAEEDQQTTTVVVASAEHVFFLPVTNINRTSNEQHLFTRGDHALAAPISALKATDAKCYDLVVESIDITARFTIKSVVVKEANERFMSDFLCFTKLSIGDQILLVAINNSIYWLQEQDTGESDLITRRKL